MQSTHRTGGRTGRVTFYHNPPRKCPVDSLRKFGGFYFSEICPALEVGKWHRSCEAVLAAAKTSRTADVKLFKGPNLVPDNFKST